MQNFDQFLDMKILRTKILTGGTEYTLKRPLEISVPAQVISKVSAVYQPNFEQGGLLEFAASGESRIQAIDFIPVPNRSTLNYAYSPYTSEFNAVINKIADRGNLPFAIHTHPVRIGQEHYDNANVKLYLTSSKADRKIASEGITDQLFLPECIFVQDERLPNGFELNFYKGEAFPASRGQFSTAQLVSGGAMLGMRLLGFENKKLSILSGLWFGVEFLRLPKYYYENGGLRITLSQ